MSQDKLFSVIAGVLLAASIALNYGQYRQIRNLRPKNAIHASLEGTTAPALRLTDVNGKIVPINYSDDRHPTVLYVMSPACSWCRANHDNVKYLAAHAGGRFRFIGVSTFGTGLPEYISGHDAGFPVYVADSGAQYGSGSTPETLVISPQGKVLKHWRGAFEVQNKTEIEKFFAVHFPTS